MADRSSSNLPPSGSSAGGAAGADRAPDGPPPGLGEQFGRTRGALIGLIRSHINLARAEFSEIADQVKRAAALGGIALFLLFLTGILIVVGLLLFLGEAIFGSIGWGVLLGSEFMISTSVLLVLAIVADRQSRIFGAPVVVAFVAALLAGLVLATQLTNQGWRWVADRRFEGINWIDGHVVAIVDRPIVVAALFMAGAFVVLGVAGMLAMGRGPGLVRGVLAFAILGVALLSALTNQTTWFEATLFAGVVIAILLARNLEGVAIVVFGLLGLGLAGLTIGLVTGVPVSWLISVALGLFALLLVWPAFAAWLVIKNLDTAKLKERFYPDQTIATTKETIEWVREQMPLGPKS